MIRQIWYLAIFISSGFATQAQLLRVDSGTVLVYDVEEYGLKYKYLVTVIQSEPLELQWVTNGKTPYKGQCSHYDSAYDYATRLLIKPNLESVEYVDESSIRLAAPYSMGFEIEDTASTILNYRIDNMEAALEKYQEKVKVKTLNFNGKKVKYLSRNYRDKMLGIRIGFMPVGLRFWVYYYKDENLTMQLQEIYDL